ncbi:MAG: hypothetical protein IJL92_03485, partial [Thermoguttaceae bacterium]|nr:hypothetical protein [Thermoguttaceae bacterium]
MRSADDQAVVAPFSVAAPIDLSAAVEDEIVVGHGDDASSQFDVEEAKTLKILFIGNSLSEDARTFIANAASQYPQIDPNNVKIGSLYQGGRSVGYFANCARVEQGEDPSSYDYDFYTYTNNPAKTQIDAENNGYMDATKNFCEYYEWNGVSWDKIKSEENLGEKTIAYAMNQEQWDVILVEGFFCDYMDGTQENGYDGTLISFDPNKEEGTSYNLRESLTTNLEYLCGYLRKLDQENNSERCADIGFFLPTIHHETQPNWIDGDVYASMIRTANYVEENVDCIDFVVPVCTAVENAKTTYLTLLTNNDSKDTVLPGLRRDAIHSSYYLARELVAMGIVDSVLERLYGGDDFDVRADYSANLTIESPVFGNLPLEYMDILQAAVSAARANPYEITPLTSFAMEDPAVTAYRAAEATDGDVRTRVQAAKDALSDRQWSDVVVNYEENDGVGTLSFSYGYTTSDTIELTSGDVANSTEDDDNSTNSVDNPETQTIIVNSLLDVVDETDGVTTLREAVALYVVDGGVITFDETLAGGTILLGGSELTISKTITIDASALYDSNAGAPGITIDAGSVSRIFKITSGTTKLNALTLVNGRSESFGGAIYVDAFAELVVEDSILSGNASLGGGAVYAAFSGDVTIQNTSLHDNTASLYGGAIYACSGSTLSLDGATLFNNTASCNGGAVRVAASTLAIQNSVLYQNAAQSGGSIDAGSSSTFTIERSELCRNSAVKRGGAIYASGKNTTHTITSARIYENVANCGGGIYASGYQTTLTVNNSVLYGNTTSREGAVIEVQYTNLDLFSSTVAVNTSAVGAGAIYAAYSSIGFYNSIVAQNEGNDVVRNGGTSKAYNVVSSLKAWGNYDATFYVYDDTKPLFTDPEHYDFTLPEDSQAFNKGDDVFVSVKKDIDGNWRVMGEEVDLGACERLVPERVSTIVDSLDDSIDHFDGVVTLREAIADYSEDGDMITFDPFLAGGTILLGGTELPIVKSLTIDASALYKAGAPGLIIDANGLSRIFNVAPDASLTIDGLKLTGGYAEEGGAIYASENTVLTIENSAICGNEALVGGGVAAYGSATIDHSRIDDNYAEFGGGVYIMGDALFSLTINNSTICGNEAIFYGGAVYSEGANVTIYSSTISMNASTGSGAVHIYSDEEGVSLNLYNSIVAENDSDDVFLEAYPQAYAYGVLSGFAEWSNDDGAYLYVADAPLFSDAENGDYTLADNSQALNLGVDDYITSNVDVAGSVRVANGAVDLGAYEKSTISVEYDASTDQTSLSWSALADAASYLVEISADGGVSWEPVAQETDATSTILEGLMKGKSYALRVTGISESGEALDEIQSTTFTATSADNLDVAFLYNVDNHQATLTWNAIEGAASYLVTISKTNGFRWTVAAEGIDATSVTIDNIKVGVSYSFRVYGVADDGALLPIVEEATLAPILIDGSVNPCVTVVPGPVGSQVVVTLSGAPNSAASVRWYYITEDGDVEIEEAAGLLEYTLTNTTYDVRIVATGIGDSEGSDSELTVVDTIEFNYNALSRQALMSWAPIDGAKSYTVKESKNGGETWSTVARTPDPFVFVNGLYASKNYSFQVYGIAQNGALLSTIQGATFAPIAITASVAPCANGKLIVVDVTGADDATVELNWYYVTEDGDVEIEDAAGLSQFTATNTLYDVKVVATGTGDSAGSNAEVVVVDSLEFDYSLATRQAVVTWDEVENADSYTIKITKDGGATWKTIGRGLTDRSVAVNGLYASRSYSFQVYGVAKSGAFLPTVQTGTFAPISTSSTVCSSSTSRTVTTSIIGADNAEAFLRWYFITEDGDVEIEEAAGLTSYTTDNMENDLKIVATGTGVSRGSIAETLVVDTLSVRFDPSTHEAALTWNENEGSTSYSVMISKDDGATWSTYLTGLEETSAVVKGVYVGKSYCFQIKNNGSEIAVVQGVTFAPISIDAVAISDSSGQTITASITGSSNTSADIKWYYVTEDGDVEIEEAEGATEYSVGRFEHDVRIVATGTGNSKGSDASALFSNTLSVNYDPVTRRAALNWNAVENATSYTVKIRKNGEPKWSTAKKINADDFEAAVEAGTSPAILNGFYTNKSYDLIVVANGVPVATIQKATIAPIAIAPTVYSTMGERTISVGLSGADNASADIRWYYVTEDGDVEIEEATGLLEYAPDDSTRDVRIVATGTGDSVGSSSEALVVDTISVAYNATTRLATLTWNEVEDATGYTVKISKDSGGTWLTQAKVTTNLAEISGIYANQSYSFQIVSTGSHVSTIQGATFAPVMITPSIYSSQDERTISVGLSGANNASADIRWYYVTEDGDVEIEEATGLLEYAPDDSTRDVRIVATGTGDSEGSSSEALVVDTISVAYNATARLATLTWNEVEDATGYTVKISKDSGRTWQTYAKVTTNLAEISGIYANQSYSFQVVSTGSHVSTIQGATFAPFTLTSSVRYVQGERTISVAFDGSDNSSADVRWYYVPEDGDVEIEEAAGLLEYSPVDATCDVRIVATGTGDSEGMSLETTVLDTISLAYDATNEQATLTWAPVVDAETYRVMISVDGGESWSNYADELTETSVVV